MLGLQAHLSNPKHHVRRLSPLSLLRFLTPLLCIPLSLISAFLTHFMSSFRLVLVLFIPLSSIFFLTFPSYFIQLIILYHSDTLLDFRSILIEFLAHMLSPCFLVFLLQVWPFSGLSNARHGLRKQARGCERPWGALRVPRTRRCARTHNWCALTFSQIGRKIQKTQVRPHQTFGAPAPVHGAPSHPYGAPAHVDGGFQSEAEDSGAPAPDIWCTRTCARCARTSLWCTRTLRVRKKTFASLNEFCFSFWDLRFILVFTQHSRVLY